MKRRALLGFLVLVVVLMLTLVAVQSGRRPDAVNFFLTADTQGFLVPCGCFGSRCQAPSGNRPRPITRDGGAGQRCVKLSLPSSRLISQRGTRR